MISLMFFALLFSGVEFYLMMVSFVLMLLQIVAGWLIFKKAGIAGWKSIIPIYNDYNMFKIAWSAKFFWITLLFSALYSLCGYLSNSADILLSPVWSWIFIILCIVLGFICLLLQFLFCRKLAFSFGKGIIFTLGLFLFYPLFLIFLGFGSSVYHKRI